MYDQRCFSDELNKYTSVLLTTQLLQSQYPPPLVYKTAHLPDDGTDTTVPVPTLTLPSYEIKRFLGFYGDRVVYLNHQLWVQAIDLTTVGADNEYGTIQLERYMFIPQSCVLSNDDSRLNSVVTVIDSLICLKEGSLAVVNSVLGCRSAASSPSRVS